MEECQTPLLNISPFSANLMHRTEWTEDHIPKMQRGRSLQRPPRELRELAAYAPALCRSELHATHVTRVAGAVSRLDGDSLKNAQIKSAEALNVRCGG